MFLKTQQAPLMCICGQYFLNVGQYFRRFFWQYSFTKCSFWIWEELLNTHSRLFLSEPVHRIHLNSECTLLKNHLSYIKHYASFQSEANPGSGDINREWHCSLDQQTALRRRLYAICDLFFFQSNYKTKSNQMSHDSDIQYSHCFVVAILLGFLKVVHGPVLNPRQLVTKDVSLRNHSLTRVITTKILHHTHFLQFDMSYK